MIRINLLAVEREKTRRKFSLQAGQKFTVLGSLVLLASAAVIGWRYMDLQKQSIQLDDDITAAQRETVRLRSLLDQVQQYEARTGQLQQRVSLIEQLRRGQSGPVHMLDEISSSLPEMLWLTSLQQKNGEVTIDGRASTHTALSDFVANLERSPYFVSPVDIVSSQVESLPQQGGELVKFSVKAKFVTPAGALAPAAASAPRAGGD